jgi:hypothetical protein
MKNCFMWKHHGHTVPCHFGCTDVCQIGVSRANNRDSGGPFLENFVASLNPAAWYRYGAGITSANGLVSAWADQSGNNRPLLQATETNQPALQSDGSILFDGVDNQMEATFTLNQPCTFYLLFKQVTWTANDIITDGSAAQVQLFQAASSPIIKLTAGGGGAPQNTALAVDTYGAVAAVFNGASSLIQVNSTTGTAADAGANNPGGFSLGANRSAASASNIEAKEAIVFPAAHDAGQRAKVIAYLAQVGNLTI